MSQFQLANCINRNAVVIPVDTSIRQAETILLREALADLYIANEQGELVGVVPDYELLKYCWQDRPQSKPVGTLMCPISIVMKMDDSLEKIIQILSHHIHPRIPVVEHRKLIGIVDRISVLRTLLNYSISSTDNKAEPADCGQPEVPAPKLLSTGNISRSFSSR